MNDFTTIGAPAAAMIIGVTEVVKRIGLPDRFAPAFALALGITFALLLYFLRPGHERIFDDLTAGITISLAAMGLYAGGRATIDK